MQTRQLVIVADDYGIGPEVSRSIRELMRTGSVTATVLLVNSPYAEADVALWMKCGCPGEMGWHPNLTMDQSVAAPGEVESLVARNGQFYSLGKLLARIAAGMVRYRDLVREFEAQLQRYCDLVGRPPDVINGHKHIHVFPIISRALAEALGRWNIHPYVRRVVEPWSCLRSIAGARVKRTLLSTLGRAATARQVRCNLPGNDYLAGITDPKWIEDPRFYLRWLAHVPGKVVELAVHPGHYDEALVDRDCSRESGQIERRVSEHRLLSDPRFQCECDRLGFVLCRPSRIGTQSWEGLSHSA